MLDKNNMLDAFLADAKTKQHRVTLYLSNGRHTEGTVKEFDDSSILVEVKGKPQMVLRQGIVSCYAKEAKSPKDEPKQHQQEEEMEKAEIS